MKGKRHGSVANFGVNELQWRRPRSASWRIDETSIKVRSKWAYLYRAVDKLGNTIDFYLSATPRLRSASSARH